MKNIIRVFIGVSIVNSEKGSYATTITSEQGQYFMPVNTITASNMTCHKLVLEAILSIIKVLKNTDINTPIRVVFYANDDVISYEWQVEYLEEGGFTSKTKDVEKWNEIIKLASKLDKKIEIEIKGTDTILYPINKLAQSRASRGKA